MRGSAAGDGVRHRAPTRDAEALAGVLDDPDIGDFVKLLVVKVTGHATRYRLAQPEP